MNRLHGIAHTAVDQDPNFWTKHVHPDDQHRFLNAMQDAIDGNSLYDTEFRIFWPDGTIRNLRAVGQVTMMPTASLCA